MEVKTKEMILELIKDVGLNLALTAAIIALTVLALNTFFDVKLQVSSTSLVIGIIGTTLAFTGNSFISDALGRYGPHELPQYIWGNRMQVVGFALTIAALLVK